MEGLGTLLLLLDRHFTLGSLAFGLERASSLAVYGYVCMVVGCILLYMYSLIPRPTGNEPSTCRHTYGVASFPVPRPVFRHLQYALSYCKRRKAGCGTGNEATYRVK